MIYIHTISCYMGEWIGINSIHQMMRQKVCSSNVWKSYVELPFNFLHKDI